MTQWNKKFYLINWKPTELEAVLSIGLKLTSAAAYNVYVYVILFQSQTKWQLVYLKDPS